MTLAFVAAVAANGVIGDRGALPWKLPDDMARFRALTMGHTVIMGHSTFQSMGRPLRGRRNVVLSRDAALKIEGCVTVHSLEEAREAAAAEEEVFIIGGAAVYELFLPDAARLHITWVDRSVSGDTKFPRVEWSQWRITREEPGAPDDAWPHRFVDYERSRA